MGKFTGLVGVVELLIFWIFGTAGGGVLLPPQPLSAIAAMAPRTQIPNLPLETTGVISFFFFP